MTKEEEAIERLEKRIKDNEDYKTTQVWLTDDVSAVYTVLNMLKDLQRENIQKDKQIDLMAEFIEKVTVDLKVAFGENMLWNRDEIKQYFERKTSE